MKLSWGHGVTILYSGFVVLILSLVSLTMKENVELVYPDYYKREVNYQGTLNKMENFNSLKQDIIITQDDSTLKFELPQSGVSDFKNGSIRFLRPSDSKLDQTLNMNLSNNTTSVSKNKLAIGYYLVQLEWEAAGKTYLLEKSITIN